MAPHRRALDAGDDGGLQDMRFTAQAEKMLARLGDSRSPCPSAGRRPQASGRRPAPRRMGWPRPFIALVSARRSACLLVGTPSARRLSRIDCSSTLAMICSKASPRPSGRRRVLRFSKRGSAYAREEPQRSPLMFLDDVRIAAAVSSTERRLTSMVGHFIRTNRRLAWVISSRTASSSA